MGANYPYSLGHEVIRIANWYQRVPQFRTQRSGIASPSRRRGEGIRANSRNPSRLSAGTSSVLASTSTAGRCDGLRRINTIGTTVPMILQTWPPLFNVSRSCWSPSKKTHLGQEVDYSLSVPAEIHFDDSTPMRQAVPRSTGCSYALPRAKWTQGASFPENPSRPHRV